MTMGWIHPYLEKYVLDIVVKNDLRVGKYIGLRHLNYSEKNVEDYEKRIREEWRRVILDGQK